MSQNERLLKLLAASPAKLRKVDAILNGDAGADTHTRNDEDVRLVTFTEAAKRLNLSRPTVYRLARAGRLEAVTINGVRRLRLSSVYAFAAGEAVAQ